MGSSAASLMRRHARDAVIGGMQVSAGICANKVSDMTEGDGRIGSFSGAPAPADAIHWATPRRLRAEADSTVHIHRSPSGPFHEEKRARLQPAP